jgi:predicted N-acetyltransferase YhbS/nitroimidazol reductase NimA-like FMN-containing flavoprotein (pyridoxamine 5'-phosphate oxidase superfamily)
VRLATINAEGEPMLRTVHAAVVGDWLVWHGAPVGEKSEAVGRAVVVGADAPVCTIPSYFLDPERACPATTYYRSVQVHGVVEAIDAPVEKAAALAALTAKHQPEGGHVPIDASHPLYAKALVGLGVYGVHLGRARRVDGKSKLGQHRTAADRRRIVEQLFERGARGDCAAIDAILDAAPDEARPAFLRAPGGLRLRCALDRRWVDQAVALLADAYWNVGTPASTLERAHLGAAAWVGAIDAEHRLVATARATSDGVKFALVADVMIAAEHRGRGVGDALMALLLRHPMLRDVRRIVLRTRDAAPFYARHGFAIEEPFAPTSFPSTSMARTQPPRAPSE